MGSSTTISLLSSIPATKAVVGSIIIACFYIVVSIGVQWYRLKHIPGPPLASLTSLCIFRWFRAMNYYTTGIHLYEKYGEIVRISPTGVLVSIPEPLWQVNSARSTYARSAFNTSLRLNPWGNNLISELDTAKHDKRKAKLISGFSGKGLMNLESNVDAQIATLVNVLQWRTKDANGPAVVDIGRTLQYFQVDLITQAGIGNTWRDLPLNEDRFGWLQDAEKSVPWMFSLAVVPLLRSIYFSPLFLHVFGPSLTKGWLGVLHEEVQESLKPDQEKAHEGNMLTEWLKHGLSPAEAELDLALLMPAGTETSITTIRGILMYLMVSPNAYQKLRQEITDGIREGRISSPVTSEETKHLPYLQAVLNEGMRLVPPVIMGLPKVVPAGGDTICGKYLPAGTEVFPNHVGLMQNQEVFGPDVSMFRPERFIDCDEATRARRLKVVDLQFGVGRWMCLGKVLAWMEMHKIFVELLRSFDFQLLNPEKPWHRYSNAIWIIKDFYAVVREDPITA
ncbi:putative cytochrome P450 monooxygenase [Cryphonectria parasitica EP155]|uniref:Cytochrome P450 monooxygenase n=1 Tax=Cryphonectria parasitica (strain ATCC 38755 / EP155) TaxID=660469 RepID=A0A9P5CPW1_CRYP1|nr:putative cytochrome P450 monooxygenase [Cryphonectria parasitica EP155]KAF3765591.1 putative cytochrome P450 monooxygenase [Cryphonectria parasitica EP155]